MTTKDKIVLTVAIISATLLLGINYDMNSKEAAALKQAEQSQIQAETKQANINKAYGICMDAHNEISGISEEACGAALDANGVIFMCDYQGVSCWIEEL
jgi:transcriptional/translational regulatory protein YebC/TACO1